MLIKAKDDPARDIALLENLLRRDDLTAATRAAIEAELARLRQGLKGERDVAYYLDFEFKNDDDWAIIHDLRLEVDGRTAQIDHVLLNRWLEVYVLESKAFRAGLKITRDGQFLYWDPRTRRYRSIPSPIAQVRRHSRVLQDLMRQEIWPRLRRPLPEPSYFPLVLIAPESRLLREPDAPEETEKYVILADIFADQLRKYTRKWLQKGRAGRQARLTPQQLRAWAQRLVTYHRPKRVDYYARYNLPVRPRRSSREARAAYSDEGRTAPTPGARHAGAEAPPRTRYFCAKCGKTISRRVALFCFQHKERFGGRAYCMDCQKSFPAR